MKELFILLILYLVTSCKNQESDPLNTNESNYNLDEEKIKLNSNKTLLEIYISEYVDSIENAANESDLPSFLSDSQFDFKNRGIWKSFHHPISVRAQIINRTNNCKSLLLIMKSQNDEIRKKPHIEDNLKPPFIELSFYDLIVNRINVLNCDDN